LRMAYSISLIPSVALDVGVRAGVVRRVDGLHLADLAFDDAPEDFALAVVVAPAQARHEHHPGRARPARPTRARSGCRSRRLPRASRRRCVSSWPRAYASMAGRKHGRRGQDHDVDIAVDQLLVGVEAQVRTLGRDTDELVGVRTQRFRARTSDPTRPCRAGCRQPRGAPPCLVRRAARCTPRPSPVRPRRSTRP
jgi:hypothetical protein